MKNPQRNFNTNKKKVEINLFRGKNRLKVATRRKKQQQCVQQVAADAINYDFFYYHCCESAM